MIETLTATLKRPCWLTIIGEVFCSCSIFALPFGFKTEKLLVIFTTSLITNCEERKLDNLVCCAYSLSLSENIEIQHRCVCF